MRYIKQLCIILAFAFAGEFIVRIVPGRLPAIVTGMVLMLIALGLKLLKPEHIKECSDFLGSIMAFFFAPSAAAILQNFKTIMPVIAQFIFIVVVCTIITFFVTYGTFRILHTLQDRRK